MSSAIGPMNPMGTPYEKGSPVESYPIASSTTKPSPDNRSNLKLA